jgi:hypothetical protein
MSEAQEAFLLQTQARRCIAPVLPLYGFPGVRKNYRQAPAGHDDLGAAPSGCDKVIIDECYPHISNALPITCHGTVNCVASLGFYGERVCPTLVSPNGSK